MAEIKIFAENDVGLRLVGDSRYVMTSESLHDEIVAWCRENNIRAKTVNSEAYMQMIFDALLWRIDNEEQRLMFALRWA
jgi:competence protein ComGF